MPMTIPPEFRAEADKLPPELRAILDAELAAGNTIAETGSRFPAPPAGNVFQINESGDDPGTKVGRRGELRICVRAQLLVVSR